MKHEQNQHVWTIGHSTHSIDEFVVMLQSFQIETVVDIRRFPGSRRYPHFNADALEISLSSHKMEYMHIGTLGGRRKPNPESKNSRWRLAAFRGYADYMDTDDYKEGIQRLQQNALTKRVAYMCSEAVWWSCHRALVSDHLKALGWNVVHIMGAGKGQEHPFTSAATIVAGKLSYEA